MEVEPASVEQVRVGENGRLYEISADASSVAADLQAIDKGLKVRFSERAECFIIRHETHEGCPHNQKDPAGRDVPGSYLVNTIKAHRGNTGVWTGLDDRIVQRIRYIHPESRSGYDYVGELEDRREQREKQAREQRREHQEQVAERLAFEVRKGFGLGSYKGRIFKPREVE